MPARPERLGEPALVRGLHVGFLRLDLTAVHELDERVVGRAHPGPTRRLHYRRDLERLRFADEVRYGIGREQNLSCSNPPATDLLAEHLRDHALERFRQHHANLLLAISRKLIDESI